MIPGATEERIYWIVGNGNPLHGNCMGYDSVWKDGDDNTVAASTTRPAGATTTTEAAYDAAFAALQADLVQVEGDLPAWYAGQRAAEQAIADADYADLVAAGISTTTAARLTGGGP